MIIPNELPEKHACPPVQPNAQMVVRRESVRLVSQWRALDTVVERIRRTQVATVAAALAFSDRLRVHAIRQDRLVPSGPVW
jgi:hypothetical protein